MAEALYDLHTIGFVHMNVRPCNIGVASNLKHFKLFNFTNSISTKDILREE